MSTDAFKDSRALVDSLMAKYAATFDDEPRVSDPDEVLPTRSGRVPPRKLGGRLAKTDKKGDDRS